MPDCIVAFGIDNDVLTIALNGRIDSVNAAVVEQEILKIRSENKELNVEVDAEKLEYISSAGLRILLRLQKGEKNKILVKNTSPSVYDIFDVTGFVEILDVKKALRKVSIDGCKVVGKGGTATVYRLDSDTIVKVFREGTPLHIIEQENARAKNAFKFGVQTAISFDVVQVGKSLGVVYELINSKDLLTCMEEDKANYKKYVVEFANFVRAMHSIEVDIDRFPSSRNTMVQYLKYLEGRFASAEEVKKMQALWEIVPESNHFIHGDCHVGNVMIQDNELMFIDLAANASGHPVTDMISMYFCYYFCARYNVENPNDVLMRSFTKEECMDIWLTFIAAYLQTEDKALILRVTEQVDAYACSRILLAQLSYPGMFTPEAFKMMKDRVMAYVDKGIEPLCF